jgi:hypothetical protein
VESVAVEWSQNDLVESSDTVIGITQEESAQYVKDIAEGRSPVTDMWAWPHVLYNAINRDKAVEEKGEDLASRLINAHWALWTITQRKVTTLIPPIAYAGSDPTHNATYLKRLETVLSRTINTVECSLYRSVWSKKLIVSVQFSVACCDCIRRKRKA